MGSSIHERLKSLNITLPEPTPPGANYLPFVNVNGLVYISGQLPFKHGKVAFTGKVGQTLSIEQGQQAARLCALHLLSQLDQACGGDLDRVQQCIRLSGFVCCGDDFTDHSSVINGASDLLCDLFQEKGKHARAAVGVISLPLGAAVEVEGLFSIA